MLTVELLRMIFKDFIIYISESGVYVGDPLPDILWNDFSKA